VAQAAAEALDPELDPRHAWSPFGGRWHKVRVIYPSRRIGEGVDPLVALGRAAASLTVPALVYIAFVALTRSEAYVGGFRENALNWFSEPTFDEWFLALFAAFAVVALLALITGAALVLATKALIDMFSIRHADGVVLRVVNVPAPEGRETGFNWLIIDYQGLDRVKAFHHETISPPIGSNVLFTYTPCLRRIKAVTVLPANERSFV
jgi:hypothetical protein